MEHSTNIPSGLVSLEEVPGIVTILSNHTQSRQALYHEAPSKSQLIEFIFRNQQTQFLHGAIAELKATRKKK